MSNDGQPRKPGTFTSDRAKAARQRVGKNKRRMSADEKLALREARKILNDPSAGATAKAKMVELVLSYERGRPVSAAEMGTVSPVGGALPESAGLLQRLHALDGGAGGGVIVLPGGDGAARDLATGYSDAELEAELSRRREMDGRMQLAPADAATLSEPAQRGERSGTSSSEDVPESSKPEPVANNAPSVRSLRRFRRADSAHECHKHGLVPHTGPRTFAGCPLCRAERAAKVRW